MANFVLLYKTTREMPSTPDEQAATMAAWGAWFGSLGAGIVDSGNPFGASGSVNANGNTNGTNSGYTGYSVISATSLANAIEASKGCPIVSQGGTVDVYETFNIM